MAILQVGLAADDFEWLPDLFNLGSVLTTSPTTFICTNSRGETITVTGADFTYTGGNAVGGTLTSILVTNGAEVLLSIAGASASLAAFAERLLDGDGFGAMALVLDGNDQLNGSSESDSLGGYSSGDDIVNGGDGDDYIQGDRGNDSIDAGGGWDTLSYVQTFFDKSAKKGIVLKVASGTVKDPWGDKDTFQNFEGYEGTKYKDKFVGSSGDEQFGGLRGADKIDGKGGWDLADYSHDHEFKKGGKSIKADLEKGTIRDGFGDVDKVKNIESVRGTMKNDIFKGSKTNNEFQGIGGKDKYDGGKGFDAIHFEANDWNGGLNGVIVNVAKKKILDDGYGNTEKVKNIESFTGTKFDDVFVGSKKNDEFKGQDGNDIMTGGKGADRFVFNPPPDSATNHDVITDFNQQEGDTMALWQRDGFPMLNQVDGGLDSAQFIANAGGAPTTAEQRIVYDTTTGKLFLDPDGNVTSGDQILIVTLANKPTITVDAFEVWV